MTISDAKIYKIKMSEYKKTVQFLSEVICINFLSFTFQAADLKCKCLNNNFK